MDKFLPELFNCLYFTDYNEYSNEYSSGKNPFRVNWIFMDTKDNFLKHWFNGVNCFLENGPDKGVNSFLAECAKSCSASYSLGLYQKAFSGKDDIKESLDYLARHFDDFYYRLFQDRIQITYKKCGCNLSAEKLITSGKLCICSEKSLLYIWENIFGRNNVKVALIKSVLNGDDSCEFEIKLKKLGHFI